MYKSFTEIQEALRAYSFESIMNLSQIESAKTMDISGSFSNPAKGLTGIAFPWEIETFVILACMSMQNDKKPLAKQFFIDSINYIRNYIDENLFKHKGTEAFSEWFMITYSQIQFECQKNYMFLFYRFNHYFTYSDNEFDMNSEFKSKFGFPHRDFLLLAQLLWFAFSVKMSCPKFVSGINQMFNKHIVNSLSISREDYNELFLKTGLSVENCAYSLRPSYSYPFISEKNNIYLPTPHLLFQAVTTSMLYRLTDNNNKLREKIGKNVFEDYLEMLSQKSGIYDEVIPEQVYNVDGAKIENRTLDLMTRIKDTIILFDSKSFTPKSALRLFSEDAYNKDVKRLAEAVKQVYTHLTVKFKKQYYYFTYDINSIIDNNVYGIVIVQEDPNIFMKRIYDKAKELLVDDGIIANMDFMKKHIGLLSIYDYERIIMCKNDIVNMLHKRENNPYYNFDLNFEDEIKDETYLKFRYTFLQEAMRIAKSLA